MPDMLYCIEWNIYIQTKVTQILRIAEYFNFNPNHPDIKRKQLTHTHDIDIIANCPYL